MTISDLRKTDNFFLLAGPCVIEGEEMALRIADRIVKITDKLGIPYVQNKRILGILSKKRAQNFYRTRRESACPAQAVRV